MKRDYPLPSDHRVVRSRSDQRGEEEWSAESASQIGRKNVEEIARGRARRGRGFGARSGKLEGSLSRFFQFFWSMDNLRTNFLVSREEFNRSFRPFPMANEHPLDAWLASERFEQGDSRLSRDDAIPFNCLLSLSSFRSIFLPSKCGAANRLSPSLPLQG